ncbi:MAG: hypothetical protein ACF8Q5_07595 [Phycisphaerales bacterium JB040]
MRALACRLLIGGALCAGVCGCVYERRTVTSSPLAGLPGAQTSENVRMSTGRTFDPTATPLDGIRTEDALGKVTLRARSPRHLMAHIYTTLANEERDLFVEQVLSRVTREEFEQRGLDPALAYDELKLRERDVLRFFNTLPFAEHTPGVHLESLGPNVFRMRSPGGRDTGLRYRFIDMVVERGEWKLRWFGS